MKRIIAVIMAMILSVSAFSAVFAKTSQSGFTDVIGTKDEWANEYIEKMVSQGIISGVGDNKFEPERTLKREELAKLVALCFDLDSFLDPEATTEKMFEDVDPFFWYEEYVMLVCRAGLMKGVSENTFGVGEGMKRCDLALLMARFEYSDEELVTFESKLPESAKDKDKIPSYAKGAMGYCYEKGLITGDENGNLNPLDFITRAQITKVLCLFMESFEVTGEQTSEPSGESTKEIIDENGLLQIPGYKFYSLNESLNRIDVSTSELSEELQYDIKAAIHNYSVINMKDFLIKKADSSKEIFLVYFIEKAFGKTSDGYYVLKMHYPTPYKYLTGKVSYEIAGEKFISAWADKEIFIYKDGYIEDLSKAYENGKVGIETVKSASQLVMEKYKNFKDPVTYEATREITPELVRTEINRRELKGIVSAETEAQIKQAMYNYYVKYEYDTIWKWIFNGDASLYLGIHKFYGYTSDGACIFMDLGPTSNWALADAITPYKVFDYIVESPVGYYSLLVYKDGEVNDICTAYSKGIIDDNTIKSFYNDLYLK